MESQIANPILFTSMESQIAALPDFLLALICEKLEKAKTLFHLSCASDRLASLITNTCRHMSVEVPLQMALSYIVNAVWPKGLLEFMAKFSFNEISIRFTSCTDYGNHLIKWKGDHFGFIFFSGEKCNLDDEVLTSQEVIIDPCYSYKRPTTDSRLMSRYINAVLKKFPDVKKISTYSNIGVVSIYDKGMEDLKSEKEIPLGSLHTRIWRMPLLRLPLSGCAIKDVYLYIETNDDNCSAESMMRNAFLEKELAEAVPIIIRKKPWQETRGSGIKFHFQL